MLERQVAENFVDLLSNNTDTLSVISSKFHSSFDIRNRMIALTGISMLLSDGLLEHSHQIVAIWLLFNEFNKVPINDSPFLPVFVHLYYEVRISNPNFCPPQLYGIVNCILGNGETDKIGSMTIKSIMSQNFDLPVLTSINLSAPKQYQPRMSPIISEKLEKPERDVMSPPQILVELLSDSTIYNDFESLYIRPAPDVASIFPGEIQETFISSFDLGAPALFDEYVSLNSKESAVSLIQKAIDTQLTPAEVDSLSREIKKNPDLSSEADLSIPQIDSLMENNTAIAKDIVLYLVKRDDKLLEKLATFQLTPAKQQVIQEILINPDLLPQQFESYVSNAMSNIEKIQNDSYFECAALFFKMLCVAVNKGKKLGVDLLVELYSFCVLPKNESLKESQDLAILLSE